MTTKDNGEIELRTGDEKGDRKAGPQSPKLERALWNVWLGAKPLSVEMRRQLIEKNTQWRMRCLNRATTSSRA